MTDCENALEGPVLPPRRQQLSRPPIAPKPQGQNCVGRSITHHISSAGPYGINTKYGGSNNPNLCSSPNSSTETGINAPQVKVHCRKLVSFPDNRSTELDSEFHSLDMSSSDESHSDNPSQLSASGRNPGGCLSIRYSGGGAKGQSGDGPSRGESRSLTLLCPTPCGSCPVPPDPSSNPLELSQRRFNSVSRIPPNSSSSPLQNFDIPALDHQSLIRKVSSPFPLSSNSGQAESERMNNSIRVVEAGTDSMKNECHTCHSNYPPEYSSQDDYYSESCSTGSNASSISSGTLSSKSSDDFSSSSSKYSAVELAEASIDRYYRNGGGGEFYDLDSVELGIQDCELESEFLPHQESTDLLDSLDEVLPSPTLAKHDMELMAENIITMISELKMSIGTESPMDKSILRPRFDFDRSLSDSGIEIFREINKSQSQTNMKQKNLPVIQEADHVEHIYEEIREDPSAVRTPRAPKPPPLPDRNFPVLTSQQFAGGRFTRGRMSLPIRENPIAKKFLELGSASLSRKKLNKRLEVGKSVGDLNNCQTFAFDHTEYSLAEGRQNSNDGAIIHAFSSNQNKNRSGRGTFSFLRKKHRSVPNLVP